MRLSIGLSVGISQVLKSDQHIPTPVLCPRKHQAPEDWTGFQTKSALVGGFALLFPVMLSLFAFRAQKESKDQLAVEQPEIEAEIKTGQRAWVPYLVLLTLLIFAVAAGMVFKFFPLFFINIYGMSGVHISVVQAIEPLGEGLLHLPCGSLCSKGWSSCSHQSLHGRGHWMPPWPI